MALNKIEDNWNECNIDSLLKKHYKMTPQARGGFSCWAGARLLFKTQFFHQN